MNNMKQIIDNHNKCILNSRINSSTTMSGNSKKCKCRPKLAHPLSSNCFQTSTTYQAMVTRMDNNTSETYVGLTENNFKIQQGTESTHHDSIMHTSVETLQNSANTSEISRTTTLLTPFRGTSQPGLNHTTMPTKNQRLLEKFIIICQREHSTLKSPGVLFTII